MKEPVKARPFVKWVGGKTGLLDQLLPLVPKKFGRYFEPFVGGGALFFALQPKQAVLSDANGELINCYFEIRDDVEHLIKVLRAIPVNAETYYQQRASVPTDSVRAAARTIYLNKTCFNGLYRVNRKGEFNVGWGKKDPVKFPTACDPDNLRACSAALRSARIFICGYDVLRMMESPVAGDFMYFDPPYAPVSKTANFTAYTTTGFSSKDQKRLADEFRKMSDRGVHCMLSNSDTPTMRKLYKGFRIDVVHAARAVNCKGTKRGKVREIVVRNYGK